MQRIPPPSPAFSDVKAYREQAHKMVDFIADYYEKLASPSSAGGVQSEVTPGYLKPQLPSEIPRDPVPFDDIMKSMSTSIMPGVTHWQHPNFYGFFQCTASFPAMVGTMLSEAVNQPGFNWVCSPVATELEIIVMDWLADAMQLGKAFQWEGGNGGGVIQPSATEAVLVAMVAAKHKALLRSSSASPSTTTTTPSSELYYTNMSRLVCYVSEQAHFCVEKAARVLMIPHIRKVPAPFDSTQKNYPMDVAALERMIEADLSQGLIPFFVSASFGTTGTTACDDLDAIGQLAEKHNLFFNIDGACCGIVAICPELRPLMKGIERADCFVVNGSKWFGFLFGSSFMFFRSRGEIVSCLNSTGVYLDNDHTNKNTVVDFKDYHLGLGRPFRSLKVYQLIMSMGLTQMQEHVRRHISFARYVDDLMQNSDKYKHLFEVVTETRFALVCFRVRCLDDSENKALLESLNKENDIFFVNTVVEGSKVVLRLSMNSPLLTEEKLDALVEKIATRAEEMINAKNSN
eukprot:PhM_4_TR9892/c0_g1_i1/m.98130/K01593/DDC; aromatic-L-amino-acid decarboxylase